MLLCFGEIVNVKLLARMKLVQCLGKLVCNLEQVLSKCLQPIMLR